MNLSQIRRDAHRRLQEDGDSYSKSVLIHTTGRILISLLVFLVTWLAQQMETEGGLSNMDTQNLLATAQILFLILALFIVPFWNAGLAFCSLQLTQRRHYSATDLLEGFRRFIIVNSSIAYRGVIYILLAFLSSITSYLFMSILPLPTNMIEELTAFVEEPVLPLTGGVQAFLAVYCAIWAICLCIVLIPRLYLHRHVAYVIMENKATNGFTALITSQKLMHRHRKELFLLDLSFWWYYLLEIGINVLLFLSLLGITFPANNEVAAWIMPIAALLLRLILNYFALPKISATYALFYQRVGDTKTEEPEKPKKVKKMPWKY